MYYQVVYTDFRSKKRTYSAMIHRSNTAAKTEMDLKIKAGHKNVVVLSGTKLTRWLIMAKKKSKLEISKTPGGYYRVYKIGEKYATPVSPKEFVNRADAKKWLERNKNKF